MISDGEFLTFLNNNSIKENIEYVIKRCVEIKRDIVEYFEEKTEFQDVIETYTETKNVRIYPEKIKCSALIVEKKARVNKETKTYQMDESYEIVKQCSIGYNDMINGIWYKKIYKNNGKDGINLILRRN